jgi:hypothetical protein
MELATKLRGPLDGVPPKQKEAYNFALEVMGTVSEALAWDNAITKVRNEQEFRSICCFSYGCFIHDSGSLE